jgi:predicted small lipoprotein YifL
MKHRYILLLAACLCFLTACGLKRNLELPEKETNKTEQTDHSASAPVAAPAAVP